MTPEPMEIVIAIIPLTTLVGLLVLAALWLLRVSRLRELKERQVLAMIEKGLTPPPEMVPLNIDGVVLPARRRSAVADRFKSAGIIVVGLGLAVGIIVGIAGSQVRVGFGIGAGVVALGVAMIVNGLVVGDGSGTAGRDPAAAGAVRRTARLTANVTAGCAFRRVAGERGRRLVTERVRGQSFRPARYLSDAGTCCSTAGLSSSMMCQSTPAFAAARRTPGQSIWPWPSGTLLSSGAPPLWSPSAVPLAMSFTWVALNRVG